MLIYNFEYIIEINKTNTIEIKILSFLTKYLEIQKNDKYEPIFSSTSKYKSFPTNKEFNNKLFIKNNKWKINNYKKSEFEQNLKLYINQLSFSNFDKICDDLKELLKNNISIKNMDIFIKELYAKIFFEEKFLTLYISLCQDLINNNIVEKNHIIAHSKLLFSKRFDYISEIDLQTNDDMKFKLKRQIFGTVQFMSLLYVNSILDNSSMIYIINELLNSDDSYINESLYIIWSIIHNKHFFDNNEYIDIYDKVSNNFNNTNNNRLKLLFQNIQKENEDNKNKKKPMEKKYNLYDYIKIYKKENDIMGFIKNISKLDKSHVLNELLFFELENNENIYIDVIKKISSKEQLINVLNNLKIDELKMDIPNIKHNLQKFKTKIGI